MCLYSSFIERLLSTATPINDSKNDNNERTNITRESECKYKRINSCLIICINVIQHAHQCIN